MHREPVFFSPEKNHFPAHMRNMLCVTIYFKYHDIQRFPSGELINLKFWTIILAVENIKLLFCAMNHFSVIFLCSRSLVLLYTALRYKYCTLWTYCTKHDMVHFLWYYISRSHIWQIPWYKYHMLTQNVLRTIEGKTGIFGQKTSELLLI